MGFYHSIFLRYVGQGPHPKVYGPTSFLNAFKKHLIHVVLINFFFCFDSSNGNCKDKVIFQSRISNPEISYNSRILHPGKIFIIMASFSIRKVIK